MTTNGSYPRLSALAFGQWVPVRLEEKALVFAGGEVSAVVPIRVEWIGNAAGRAAATEILRRLKELGCRDVRLVRVSPTLQPESQR